MTTKWAHLPNAEHIDRIIASVNAYPKTWEAAWAAQDEEWDTAWIAAKDVARKATRNEAWGVARKATRDTARVAAWNVAWDEAQDAALAGCNAILALVAYDDCAYLLDCEPDELRILSKLGDNKAVLLLPACIAFKEVNALQGCML